MNDASNEVNMIMIKQFLSERGKYKLNKLDRGSIKFSKKSVYPIEAPDSTLIYPGNGQKGWSWRWSEEKVKWGIENKFIEIKKGRDGWSVYFKQYQHVDNNNVKIDRELPYKNLLIEGFNNKKGSNLLKNMGISNFSYPKPIELINFILNLFERKDLIVLDFFAGSGTTGHAILELNKHDEGNRRFILCTNNENNICEKITHKRIQRAISGYTTVKGKKIDGIPSNLRYYRTKKIEKTNNNELDQFNLLNKTLELIQIKENAFETTKSSNHYSILNNNDKVVGLYSFGFIDSIEVENMLDELMESNKENKVAYVPIEDVSEIYDYIDDKYIGLIEFEKMPKELIEIYNKLNRN